ncbi:Regulator of differentiation 1 [Echinococcus multilocularis]|uniref:Regulator of differentiation 1 n=1 Tax=Echinococcus multilocularis TaxID=6211 RepID=A0A068Y927_ECHMU|nr:Regulator of differentiation 1 [Echinococcus multilocularis]
MSSLSYSQLMSSKRKRVPDAEAVTSNGEGHAAAMEVEINEHKKSRMDQVDTPPSSVVHIRSLPVDATEQDVTLLAIPFGFLKNMVLSKRSSQALIEMELLESAMDMVEYYQEYPAILHGRQLVLQFSKHPHLELKAENAIVNQAIQRANSVVQQDLSGANQGNPNTVLRIIIEDIMDQQINHIIIYKIFHRFGKILRVIIFLKNDHYQGFIEFENHLQAFVAMLHLNRQNIYTGCCHLSVEFSKNRGPLEIRQESQKCRDYVLNPLTEDELTSLRRLPSAGMSNNVSHGGGHGQGGHAFGPNSAVAAAMSQFTGTAGGPTMLHPHQQTPAAMPPAWVAAAANNNACRMTEFTTQLMALAQQAGLQLSPAAAAATASFMSLSAQSGAAFPNAANGAAINPTMASLLAFSAAANNAAANQGQSGSGRAGGGNSQFSGAGSVSQSVTALQKLTAAQAAAAAAQSSSLAIRLPLNNNGSTVLIVSNLNEERVYPDALFTLFGVYGDVVRVKIMFNKKDTALIQFSDSQQAILAMQYLNQKVLWGQPMKIAISRHNYVQLPKEDKDNHLTKDYSNNLLHRFRKPNSKNYQNIYPPSHVLHLSNIPPSVTEDDVRTLFRSKGFDVVGFRFMQFYQKHPEQAKDNKMALVQLDSVESAMEALIALHNTQLSENSHLRISFSKSAI